MNPLTNLEALKAFTIPKDDLTSVQGGRTVEFVADPSGSGLCGKYVDGNDGSFRKWKVKDRYEDKC